MTEMTESFGFKPVYESSSEQCIGSCGSSLLLRRSAC